MSGPRLRTELKFVVHHSVQTLLMARWDRCLLPAAHTDAYATTPILSLYYDSPDLDFYREKLDGVAIRNKVRLRVYGTRFEAGQTAFVEIKHRVCDKVLKIREQLMDFTAADVDPRRWRLRDPAKMAAFSQLLLRHQLRPTAQVYYQRQAYEGVVEPGLRVTWDSNLIALHPFERLERWMLDSPTRRVMPHSLAILEVKATRELPRWVHEGVVVGELRQQTVPKYITAIETLGLHRHRPSRIFAGIEPRT